MITQEMMKRINELTRKKRSVGLSAEETAEQNQLYQQYFSQVQGQIINLPNQLATTISEVQQSNPVPEQPTKIFQQTQIILGQRIFH